MKGEEEERRSEFCAVASIAGREERQKLAICDMKGRVSGSWILGKRRRRRTTECAK